MWTNSSIKKKFLICKKGIMKTMVWIQTEIVFFNNSIIDVFLFIPAKISLVVSTIVLYIVCRHTKLKSLVTSIGLQQIRGADVVSKQEHT